MADMDLIFPSYAQHERIAAALEAIALNGGAVVGNAGRGVQKPD